MGLDWGIEYKNNNLKEKISLISFCSWNTKELLMEIQACADSNGELSIEKFMTYLKEISRVDTIFAGLHESKIENWEISKKVDGQYSELCYDLDIPYDSVVVPFALIRLSNLYKFLREGDLLDEFFNPGCKLFITASW